jgi:hypothetical protein
MDRIDRIKKDEGKNVSLFILSILSILFEFRFRQPGAAARNASRKVNRFS